MPAYSDVITTLINALEKLPGIGPKSAERMITTSFGKKFPPFR